MEEQRIGMMYVNMVKRSFTSFWDRMFGSGLRRSPLLPFLLILVIAVPVIGWSLHIHGKFATLKREVRGQSQSAPVVVPRPGGQDPLVLTRQETPGSNMPQFLSATLLPGLGMDVLQLTAYLPGSGEVPLFAAPTVQQMADINPDAHPDQASNDGELEAPWAGSLVGLASPAGSSLNLVFRGRTFELPVAAGSARSISFGGLLPLEGFEASQQNQDQAVVASASLVSTDFNGRWPSKTDVNVGVQLAARTFDLRMLVRNTGTEPEPVGAGWQPQFLIHSGERAQVQLRIPAGEQLVMTQRVRDIPSGKLQPSDSAVSRLQGHPAALDTGPVEASLIHLKAGMLDSMPIAEYRDPASGYGLRMTAVSPTIREFRVDAPASAKTVSFGMQTNLDDPLGTQWAGEPGGGIAILQPGQSLEWKIRLEIFPVTNPQAPMQ
jgi:aldose 1-epimerase